MQMHFLLKNVLNVTSTQPSVWFTGYMAIMIIEAWRHYFFEILIQKWLQHNIVHRWYKYTLP